MECRSVRPSLPDVDRGQFEQVVDEALEDLPEWVLDSVDNLQVVVKDWPSPGQGHLLGLYEGVSLHDRAGYYSGSMPDRITVFMGPHLGLRLSPGDLKAEIRKTVLHELAHHLGMDDDRLDELGY